jgi:protein O-mannosyl-transferase
VQKIWVPWLALLAVMAVTAAVYAPSVPGGFVWDDRALILNDEQVHSTAHAPSLFTRDFFAPGEDDVEYGYYRPLVSLSYMLDWAAWGENPLGYRLTNLLWHLAATALLFVLLLRVLPPTIWPATVGAAMFGLQPVHVESVAWIAGRTDVICTALALGALVAWQLYLEKNRERIDPESIPKKKRRLMKEAPERSGLGWVALAAVLLLGSLLAKEMGFIAVAMVWPWAYLTVARDRESLRRVLPELAVLTIPAAIYLLLRVGLAGVTTGVAPEAHTWVNALMTFPSALTLYLGRLVLPINFTAYMVHPYVSHPFSPWGAVGLGLIVLAGVLLWQAWKKMPLAALMLTGLLLSFVPLANLVRISAPADMGFPMADRFLYLPGAFFAALWAVAVQDSRRKRSSLILMLVFLGLASVVYFRVTVEAAERWTDEAAVFEHALQKNENAPLLWTTLGATYRRAARNEEALAALEKARDLNEKLGTADPVAIENNLGTALAAAGRLPEALAAFDRAATFGRQIDRVQFNRGEALRLLSKKTEALVAYEAAIAANSNYLAPRLRRAALLAARDQTEAARAELKTVLGLSPGHLEAKAMLARLGDAPVEGDPRLLEANRLFRAGKIEEAEALLRAVLADDPEQPEALVGLAHVERRRGNPAEAQSLLQRAVRVQPDNPHSWLTLGAVQGQQKDYVASEQAYRRALTLLPEEPQTRVGLASALFQNGKRDEAGAVLEEAAKLFPDDLGVILGQITYAFEAGDPDQARAYLQRAAELAPTHPQVKTWTGVLSQ